MEGSSPVLIPRETCLSGCVELPFAYSRVFKPVLGVLPSLRSVQEKRACRMLLADSDEVSRERLGFGLTAKLHRDKVGLDTRVRRRDYSYTPITG